MAAGFRFAVCNEVFQNCPVESGIERVRALGYAGIEIAPFTLASDPAALSETRRREIRSAIEASGLHMAGLHWLLTVPPGLHMTTRDELLRRRTWEYVYRLVDLCADLGGGVMVFGSPKQRSTVEGMNPDEAAAVLAAELAAAAACAEARGVKLLLEALPKNQTNVVNSLAEAVAIVRQIDSPAVQTMFDTHNAVDEIEPHADLIRRYFPYIAHVHVNETDGREPGMGSYDFSSVLAALADLNYSGWISVEAFDFSRDAEEIAGGALRTLRAAMPAQLQTI
ncbi:MAG TPA: sugar phosphate isomerase/epimerase family protein [Bryobacteraceae bacterium]